MNKKDPLKPSKRAIKRGLKLKGMEGRIKRLKSYWRNNNPSDAILNRWIRFRVMNMITAEILNKWTTDQMIDLFKQVSEEE